MRRALLCAFLIVCVGISPEVGIKAQVVYGAGDTIIIDDDSPPRVIDVNVTDTLHLEVEFDEPVEFWSAKNVGNYVIVASENQGDSLRPVSATLRPNEMAVVLALASPLLRGSAYVLGVTGVEDRYGNSIPDTLDFEFVFEDTAPIELVTAWVISDEAVEVIYNKAAESVTAEDVSNYRIALVYDTSQAVPVNAASLSSAGTSVMLTPGGSFSKGSNYILFIRNIRDLDGHTIDPATSKKLFDSQPPEVADVYVPDPYHIMVTFSERMDEQSGEAQENYSLRASGGAGESIEILEVVLTANSTVAGLELAEMIESNVEYVLGISGVRDLMGNKIDPNTEIVIGVSDSHPPELLSAEAAGITEVIARFSEPLDEATAADAANYEVSATGDPSQSMLVASAALRPDGTEVAIYLLETLESNLSYTLHVTGVRDIAGNTIEPGSSANFSYQVFPAGYIGLYADAGHSTQCVNGEGMYPFEMWIWCRPSARGQICAEFRVLYPANTIQSTVTSNTDIISVTLGDLAAGMDVCYLTCQTDWHWPFHQAMYVTDPTQTMIEIGPHPDAGVYQFANCEDNYPVEPCIAYPALHINVSSGDCPEDSLESDPPVVVEASARSERAVYVVFSEPVDITTAEDTGNYSLSELNDPSRSIGIGSASLGTGWRRVDLSLADDLVPGVPYILRISDVTDILGNMISPGTEVPIEIIDSIPPELLSAEAAGSTEVIARFSEPLDEATAVDAVNYEVSATGDPSRSVPVASAALSPDGTEVAIYLIETLESNLSYTLHVTGVRDIAGNTIEPGSSANFSYQVFPAGYIGLYADAGHSMRCVSGAGMYQVEMWIWCLPSGRGQICAEFRVLYPANVIQSNVTSNTDIISVTLGELATGMSVCYLTCQTDWHWPFHQALWVPDPTQTVVEIGPHPEAGVYQFANCNDGFPVEPCNAYPSLMINVLPEDCPDSFVDLIPPEIAEASIVSGLVVDVVFSEPVDAASAEEASNYSLHMLNDASSAVSITGADLDGDGIRVRLSLGDTISVETSYILGVSDVKDLSGHPIVAGSEVAIYERIPPELVSVELIDLGHLGVTFSESMNEQDVESAGNYLCHITGDPASSVAVSGASLDSTGMNVTLTIPAGLSEGASYTLAVSDVADLAGNLIAPESGIDFFVPDERPPVIARAKVVSTGEVEVIFSEGVDSLTAADSSNYELFEHFGSMLQVPITAARQLENRRIVRLSAGNSLSENAEYILRVSNVQDLAGNIIAPESEYLIVDTAPPLLVDVRVSGQYTIDATFNEPLDQAAAGNRSNYSLYETLYTPRVIGIAEVELLPGGTTVRLRYNSFLRHEVSHILSVDNVRDIHGNVIFAPLRYSFMPHDIFPPELLSARVTNSNTIEIIFNEPLNEAAAMNSANYEIFISSDPAVTFTIGSIHLSNWNVTIDLAESLIQGFEYTVRVNNISDVYGNSILPDSEIEFSYSLDHFFGLYVDIAHDENEVFFSASPTQFTIYVWCLPGLTGVFCEEFAVSYPPNVLAGPATSNDAIISVMLGDLAGGMSCCFTGCQQDWFWTYSQTCFITDQSQTIMEIVPHPDVGAVQAASCAEGYPIEPVGIMSNVYINPSHATVATYLESYSAGLDGHSIEVKWSLSQIDEGAEFHVLRGSNGSGDFHELATRGIARSGLDFEFKDGDFEYGCTYRYRIEYSDDGERRLLFESDPVEVPELPLTLDQNYPNPFNPATTIRYYLPAKCRVTLDIFDINGKLVIRLVDAVQPKDAYAAGWEGRDASGIAVASGVYFYRLTAGKERISRKMVLLR